MEVAQVGALTSRSAKSAISTGPPLHVHEEQDDTFFVLDGTLCLQIGDERYDLEPGDFATIPPGVAHTFDNIRRDQAPVKTCNLMTPGGLDQFFFDVTQLSDHARDPDKTTELSKKHGVTVVGPTLGQRLGLA